VCAALITKYPFLADFDGSSVSTMNFVMTDDTYCLLEVFHYLK